MLALYHPQLQDPLKSAVRRGSLIQTRQRRPGASAVTALTPCTPYLVPPGLDIHILQVKPPQLRPGQTAVPLLLVHGWPGSVYEFYRMIPLLTEPAKHGLDPSITFEVTCPSIPGYGFSEAPHKKGTRGRSSFRGRRPPGVLAPITPLPGTAVLEKADGHCNIR